MSRADCDHMWALYPIPTSDGSPWGFGCNYCQRQFWTTEDFEELFGMGRLEIIQRDGEHSCDPPGPMLPPGAADAPVGSRWFCDCGQVWIVRWVNSKNLGVGQRIVSHAEWFRESWWERRRRVKGKDVLRVADPQPSPRRRWTKPPKPPKGGSGISSSKDGVR